MGSSHSTESDDESASESSEDDRSATKVKRTMLSDDGSDYGATQNSGGLFGGLFASWGCGGSPFVKTDDLKLRRASYLKVALADNTDKALEDYFTTDLDTVLGTGGFGSVCKGMNKQTGAVRAIKAMPRPRDKKRWQGEIESMMRCDHPNVVRLYQHFETVKSVWLIMDICEGGELFDRIQADGHFTEQNAATVMRQIFKAVGYMHTNGVCHRDLKPENFLFQKKNASIANNTLKVIDFGIAACFDPPTGVFHTKAGTPDYTAPEVYECSSWSGYGQEVDMWSSGVVLYAVLAAQLPFSGNAQQLQKLVSVAKLNFSSPIWQTVSDEAKELIRNLIVKDPRERLTAVEALEDSWVQGEAAAPPNAQLTQHHVAALKLFRNQNRMKKLALNVMARSLDADKIEELTALFESLDANGDGCLTTAELRDGLRQAGMEKGNPDLKAIMDAVDADGSGEIDYTEFLAATLDQKYWVQDSALKAAFRVFDKDDDGRISPEELQEILKSKDVSGKFSKRHIDDLMKEVDTNGDGYIDFQEFMVMMRNE